MGNDMHAHLPAATPDYNYLLTVVPQRILDETGEDIGVEVHKGYGVSVEACVLTSQAPFYLEFDLEGLSEDEANTMFGLYHDPNKACCTARSFKWQHPFDGYTYVVRFDSEVPRSTLGGMLYKVGKVKMKVLGNA